MEFIKLLEDCLNKKSKKNFLPMQSGDVEETYASNNAIQEWIGFKPKTSLKDGTKSFIKWYKD